MKEVEAILQRYERRRVKGLDEKFAKFSTFRHFLLNERNHWIAFILQKNFYELSNLRLLEIGAGKGNDLHLFLKLGFKPENVYANELRSEFADSLANIVGSRNVLLGDASTLDTQSFDVIFQSVVFSSILDPDYQMQLSNRMWDLLKPGGLILWYDATVGNPWNADFAGVPIHRIQSLFYKSNSIQCYRVTLAPPLARRVGRFYDFFNFSFLRTHVVAGIFKSK